jgi:hypothetical protein
MADSTGASNDFASDSYVGSSSDYDGNHDQGDSSIEQDEDSYCSYEDDGLTSGEEDADEVEPWDAPRSMQPPESLQSVNYIAIVYLPLRNFWKSLFLCRH